MIKIEKTPNTIKKHMNRNQEKLIIQKENHRKEMYPKKGHLIGNKIKKREGNGQKNMKKTVKTTITFIST